MKRRGLTILVGCLLLAGLLGPIAWVPVSYVGLGPGQSFNTLGVDPASKAQIIEVSGAQTSKSSGKLLMVTVSVWKDMTLYDAVRGWWNDELAVVPKELVYPSNMTDQQVDQENTREFTESQSSAETAALRALGYPVQVTVAKVTDGYPAAAVLAAGDVITAVDGKPVTSRASLIRVIEAKGAGASHEVTYQRSGEPRTATIGTKKGEDGTPKIGVSVDQKQPHPFKITFKLNDVGGPSAGLMFTLALIDLLKAEDLTGGKTIAGTGTIDDDGNVGPIGGIRQKMIAAKRDGAKVFLTPKDNCAEALANAQSKLPLARVANLTDALNALVAVRENRTPALCTRDDKDK